MLCLYILYESLIRSAINQDSERLGEMERPDGKKVRNLGGMLKLSHTCTWARKLLPSVHILRTFPAVKSNMRLLGRAFILIQVIIAIFQHVVNAGSIKYSGINEAGLEFNGINCSPTSNSVNQFLSEGHNLVRIPIAWEKLQHCLSCGLDTTYMNLVSQAVNLVTSKGGIALVDLHNYFRYNGALVTDASVFANTWKLLARSLGSSQQIWFGLMNEPHDMSTEMVLSMHQQAIDSIRSSGMSNKIIISGNGWDSLAEWASQPAWYGTSNTILSQLKDPINNYAFEMHIYFDYDNSGTHSECVQFDRSKAQRTTDWLRSVGKTALVTEFGLAKNDNCVNNYGRPFLQFLADNSDVWEGYTYWSAGSCWPDDYIFTVDPHNGVSTSDARVQLLDQFSAH